MGVMKMDEETKTIDPERAATTEAVAALDLFTKAWCLDKEATDKYHSLIFRCSNCTFLGKGGGQCLVKVFAFIDNEHDYPMDKFGAMN